MILSHAPTLLHPPQQQGFFSGTGGGIYNRGSIVVDGESNFSLNGAAVNCVMHTYLHPLPSIHIHIYSRNVAVDGLFRFKIELSLFPLVFSVPVGVLVSDPVGDLWLASYDCETYRDNLGATLGVDLSDQHD